MNKKKLSAACILFLIAGSTAWAIGQAATQVLATKIVNGSGTHAINSSGTVTDPNGTGTLAFDAVFTGDSGAGGAKGLVPAPAAGDAASAKFLGAGGIWTVPSGSGNVTGQASSVDSEIVLFSSTTGKVIKRATGTGLVPVTSGVYGTPGPLTGDVTTSGAGLATTAAATQANIQTLSLSTGVAVHGSNTNDSAAAGYVGEYIFATSAGTAVNFPTTNTWGDAGSTSLTLTAGDWDVSLVYCLLDNSATLSNNSCSFGVSTTTGNSSTGLVVGDNQIDQSVNTISNSPCQGGTIGVLRKSLSGSTNVYGKVKCLYTAGTPQYNFRLSARRVR